MTQDFSKDELSLIVELGTDVLAKGRTLLPEQVAMLVRKAHGYVAYQAEPGGEPEPEAVAVYAPNPISYWCETCEAYLAEEDVMRDRVGVHGGHAIKDGKLLHFKWCHRITRSNPVEMVSYDPSTKHNDTRLEDLRKMGRAGRSDIILLNSTYGTGETGPQLAAYPTWSGVPEGEAMALLNADWYDWACMENRAIIEMARTYPEMGWYLSGTAPQWWTSPCRHPRRDQLGYCETCFIKAHDCKDCRAARSRRERCQTCGMHEYRPDSDKAVQEVQ